jgi:hypothetical protein
VRIIGNAVDGARMQRVWFKQHGSEPAGGYSRDWEIEEKKRHDSLDFPVEMGRVTVWLEGRLALSEFVGVGYEFGVGAGAQLV